MLTMTEELYMGNSYFPESDTCGTLHQAVQEAKANADEPLSAGLLRTLEADIGCLADIAKEAEGIEVDDEDWTAERAFNMSVEVLKRLFVVRHAGDRFEMAANEMEQLIKHDEESASKRKLVALLKRVIKSF